MSDPHLNLFYSYNRDRELIENNLTRALIASLKLLSPQLCSFLIKKLLEPAGKRQLHQPDFHLPDLIIPEFALQDHISPHLTRNFNLKYLIAIASNRYIEEEDQRMRIAIQTKTYGGSIPDGWVFDQGVGVCFLLEAKVGFNPLNSSQLFSHAEEWFNFDRENTAHHLISVDWEDLVDILFDIRTKRFYKQLHHQEILIISELEYYLKLFGYHRISGPTFKELVDSPSFRLGGKKITQKILPFDYFKSIKPSPNLKISP